MKCELALNLTLVSKIDINCTSHYNEYAVVHTFAMNNKTKQKKKLKHIEIS